MSRVITRSQRDWLEAETAGWLTLGIVSAEQTEQLLGLYETKDAFTARQQSRGLLTLMAFAATFIGLGVLLLIGYNWDQMPAGLKVTAIFGAVIGAHGIGFRLRYQSGWRRLSEVFFFLGCLFYGSAMWLLAQIFHISSSNYDALWWWALGSLPIALLLDSVLIHLLVAGLLATWVGLDVFSLERLFWGVPDAGYTLPLLVVPGILWSYRKGSPIGVGIYMPVLAWWVVLLPIAWKLQANPSYFIGAVGSLLLLLAALHPPRSEMGLPFRFYGVAIVGATLLPLGFFGINKAVNNGPDLHAVTGVEQMLIILAVALLILIPAYFLQRSIADDRRSVGESLREIARRQAIPLGLLGLFAFLAIWGPATEDPWVPTIAANAAMVGLAFWLIRLGLSEDRGRPFGAGVAYLLLWTVLRYIDLFGAFGGMLGAALIFFLCGAALFTVAFYWRNRKAVSFD